MQNNDQIIQDMAATLTEIRIELAELRRDIAHNQKGTDDIRAEFSPIERRVTLIEGGLMLLGAVGFGTALKLFNIV